jgi:hypothetical protein
MAIIVPVATKFDDSGLKKAKKGFGGFGKSLKGLLGGVAIAAGFAAITGALKDSVKAAAADVKSQKLLALQLKNTTKATKAQIDAVEDYLGKLSMQVGIQDDELRPSFSNLVRQVPNVNKAQKMFTLALDASAASGKPLGTIVNALGKYYNGNKTALIRLFPELKNSKNAMDQLAESTKGAARASADPFSRFEVAVGELSEQFGKKLLPEVIKFVDYLTETVVPEVSQFIEDMSDPDTDAGQIFQQLKDFAVEFFDTIKEIAASEEFKENLERVLFVAEKLLGVLEAINNPKGWFEESANQLTAKLITSSPFASVEAIQDLGKTEGLSLSKTQAARALKDYIGGADGNPDTPWPMAKGGVVMPRAGGTIARIGEAGQPEAVIPLDRWKAMAGGGKGGSTYNITIIGGGANLGQTVVDAIKGYERTNGSGWRS